MGALCGKSSPKKPKSTTESPAQEKYIDNSIVANTNDNYKPINKTELSVKHFIKHCFGEHASRYQVDEHKVTSKDGHILKFFRVNLTHDEKENCFGNMHKISHTVVLPVSPTMSPDVWFQGHHEHSPGGYYVNKGYDVWVTNMRASKYSHSHTDPNISPKEYFNFSMDEIVEYDYPAIFNYIVDFKNLRELEENNKITILECFGSAIFLAMLANMVHDNPDRYSFPFDCIEKVIGFCNIYFHKEMKDKLLKSHVMDQKQCELFLKRSNEMKIYNWHCGWANADTNWKKLEDWMIAEGGWDDMTHASDMLKPNPEVDNFEECVRDKGHRIALDGTSVKCQAHGYQLADSTHGTRFNKFNYGEKKNKEVYGTANPPGYALDKYEIPSWSIVGTGDMDMTPEQIEKYRGLVSPNCRWEIVELEDYTFLRFFWPKDPTPFHEALDKIMIEHTLS